MLRYQIAAHEALRASAEPRCEVAANFAAQTERATQDVLRRALALGDRTPVEAPLREMAKQFGVTVDEAGTDWRALAFEALGVMLDVSRERERREVGTYEEPTPIFRSVMARRSASPAAALPVGAAQSSAPTLAIPAAAASVATSIAVTTMPAATTPQTAIEAAVPLQAPVDTASAPAANADTVPAKPETPEPAAGSATAVVAVKDDDTAFRIKLRPPLLKNIDLRDLSPETQEILRTKPRGITLLEGIQLMKELKIAGYGDDFSVEQTGDAEAGKKWKSGSVSKANVAEKFWVEFVRDVPFEDASRDDIRDGLKILPQLPYQHSRGKTKFVAEFGFKALVEDLEAEEERIEKHPLELLALQGDATGSDREKAALDARIPRIRAETRAKHRSYVKSVGKMLYDLQLIDRNPFEICGVSTS